MSITIFLTDVLFTSIGLLKLSSTGGKMKALKCKPLAHLNRVSITCVNSQNMNGLIVYRYKPLLSDTTKHSGYMAGLENRKS